MLNLYLPNGYLNMDGIIETGYPFIIITGARGTGKTFGSLDYSCRHRDEDFLYLRRTMSKIKEIQKPKYSPFKALQRELGYNVDMVSSSATTLDVGEIEYDEKEKPRIAGKSFGTVTALTTFCNLRGFDAENLKRAFYDEFIPEKHEKRIRDEGEALKSAYETIARNRELKGEKPFQLICMANSNRLDNDIHMSFRLVGDVIKMRQDDVEYRFLRNRGILLIDIRHSPISELKRDTALYRAIGEDDDYFQMAIENEFVGVDLRNSTKRNLREYKPIVEYGEVCFYEHKSKPVYYASRHVSGSPPKIGISGVGSLKFKKFFPFLIDAYLRDEIEFEEYYLELLFLKYLKLQD